MVVAWGAGWACTPRRRVADLRSVVLGSRHPLPSPSSQHSICVSVASDFDAQCHAPTTSVVRAVLPVGNSDAPASARPPARHHPAAISRARVAANRNNKMSVCVLCHSVSLSLLGAPPTGIIWYGAIYWQAYASAAGWCACAGAMRACSGVRCDGVPVFVFAFVFVFVGRSLSLVARG